ncbi:MAG: sigma-70 family RNA polymerase sigma factor [Acidobacteriota bacterium]
MTDLALERIVERCRAGDDRAWEALVDATANDLYRLAVSFTRRRSEAEDLTQEVYLKLWQNLHRYELGSSFRAWAFRIARNHFVDAFRRSRHERHATWIDPEFLESLPGSDDPHTSALRQQRLQLAHRALAQLPEDLAEIILLRDFGDWSYDELSAQLELPLGTVKSRLNRARRELASVLHLTIQPPVAARLAEARP